MASVKILFLDFDGVLNSRRYLTQEYDGADPDGLTFDQAQIDPAAVARLNRIVAATGCWVVVSSAWRLSHSLDYLRELLRSRGFEHAERIIGTTPPRASQEGRGHEIQAWLDGAPLYGIEVSQFAIVDDDSDMFHLEDRLVKTSFEEGLQDHHVDKIVVMLRAPKPTLVVPSAEFIARLGGQQ